MNLVIITIESREAKVPAVFHSIPNINPKRKGATIAIINIGINEIINNFLIIDKDNILILVISSLPYPVIVKKQNIQLSKSKAIELKDLQEEFLKK